MYATRANAARYSFCGHFSPAASNNWGVSISAIWGNHRGSRAHRILRVRTPIRASMAGYGMSTWIGSSSTCSGKAICRSGSRRPEQPEAALARWAILRHSAEGPSATLLGIASGCCSSLRFDLDSGPGTGGSPVPVFAIVHILCRQPRFSGPVRCRLSAWPAGRR
jgi:hypothetical protein